MDAFGTVIKALRKERKLTQNLLCEGICSQSVLSRIENNEELPNIVVMQALCRRLGVTIDQVMQQGSTQELETQQLISQLRLTYRAQNYARLARLLDQIKEQEDFYLDADIQLVCLYKASCELYLNGNYEVAINHLERGMAYTAHPDKVNATDLEILLLGSLGQVYSGMGKLEKAEYYFRKSLMLFDWTKHPRIMSELSKTFFDCATFFIRVDEWKEARTIVIKGINWTREHNSYYYLRELFLLKSKICSQAKEGELAELYDNLAAEVEEIATTE